jgi:hypothetical protein
LFHHPVQRVVVHVGRPQGVASHGEGRVVSLVEILGRGQWSDKGRFLRGLAPGCLSTVLPWREMPGRWRSV